ncbi:TRAP transporter small permease subunit [Psychromonas sp. SR45-3]|uniref:TRAP transporter small permease subunit n=1 Tax=Psychromonas sp. SR45-3 TaxID=2760930 RepID=UPI0015F7B46F|nr:TRAP transporter small permease subunit [Psychromonas sp. SR45-3]MBB1271699.1 TRAP transporter small permease subunit [Psychromonas sp. SR45-3]
MEGLQNFFDRFSDYIGKISTTLMLLLLANVFYDVVARYFFKYSSIGLQELEWHIFASMFLLGIAYTLKEEGHVRVDILYEKLSLKNRAWINCIGCVLFLLPFCALVIWYSYDFALESYHLNETSGDPGGLSHRWLIKAMIPLSTLALVFSGLGMLVKNLRCIVEKDI